MDVNDEWYDMIAQRTSRRRFDGRAVPGDLRERLEAFCDGEGGDGEGHDGDAPARVRLVDDPERRLFTGIAGGYGKVAGTRLAAAVIGRTEAGGDVPEDVQGAAGYLGEAFILEATRLGLGTCWIAGSFDKDGAGELAGLEPGERVVAVTPVGYPTAQKAGSERVMRTFVKASARLSVEKLAPGILDGGWPDWAVSAVQAVRRAPSGANRQPWRFRLEQGALIMSGAERLYWTAPIDFGIARLHVELGARHAGVTGAWTELGARHAGVTGAWTERAAPDVAVFTPEA